jgi:hypothetical protein
LLSRGEVESRENIVLCEHVVGKIDGLTMRYALMGTLLAQI